VRYGIIAMASNMALNIILAIPFGYVGLAIATSLSALLNASLLGYNLWKDGVLKRYPGTLTYLSKVTVAAAAMAVTVLYLTPVYNWWLIAPSFERMLKLAWLIGVGAVVYLVALLILRVKWRTAN
jgi:putative peptidoglycan lipid II flippase